ncbi:MAG: amino acid ABC transporter substrate-binding protein [Desulfobacteraceae bacterium]|nr:amino acid ABC transporter substrate-binding protein [Desulfobacteraceae bacterium]
MKKIIAALILTSLFFPANAFARKLIFATNVWPPYTIVKKLKVVNGSGVEIVKEVCKRVGIEPEFKVLSWKRCLKEARNGRIDGLYSVYKNKERLKTMYYTSESMNIAKTAVFVRKGSNIKINILDDIKGKVIGVLTDFKYGPKFDAYSGLRKQYYEDNRELVQILTRKRINVVAAHEGPFKYIAKELGLNSQVEIAYILSEDPVYISFSKKALGSDGENLAEKFSNALQKLKEEGVVQKIINNYQ